MLEKLHRLTNLQILGIIVALGLAVFFTGLASPFMGDDMPQIIDNPPVHLITNVVSFFGEGTFYNGADQHATGSYRPLMTTIFSLLYTIFGANPIAFHVLQLILHILCAFVLFLILGYFLRRPVSLGLALIFLVHPLNGGAVFAIPAMQEPLFLLFGLLAFWTLLRFQAESYWYLLATGFLLILSILSKETGILFVGIALLYLLLTNRKRFYIMLVASIALVGGYLLVRAHAVGSLSGFQVAPIDNLSLGQRLLNEPQMAMFYFTRFLFPIHLAQAYYWAYPSVSVRHFLLPLLFDGVLLAVFVYAGMRLYRDAPRRYFMFYIFFGAWLAAGLLFVMQLIPLDMTVCETWFYLPGIAVLAMVGATYEALSFRYMPWRHGLSIVVIVIIAILGVRTLLRGLDWHDQTALAYRNIAVSKEDYISYNLIANDFVRRGMLMEAKTYVEHSVAIYPAGTNYNTLGAVQMGLQNYTAARGAFQNAIKYGGDSQTVYDNLALLYAVGNNSAEAKSFYSTATQKFPHDPNIWFGTAVFANNNGYAEIAEKAIGLAQKYGDTDQNVYDKIMKHEPVTITLSPAL